MVNGLTGWMANVDIGNLRNFYLRYPLISIFHWTPATSQFSENLETGFIVYGNQDINSVEELHSNPIHDNFQVSRQENCLIINIISTGYQELKLDIFDLAGRTVNHPYQIQLHPGSNSFPIELENLPKGIYFTNIQLDHQHYLIKFSVIN
jgi:hypothetical protein